MRALPTDAGTQQVLKRSDYMLYLFNEADGEVEGGGGKDDLGLEGGVIENPRALPCCLFLS